MTPSSFSPTPPSPAGSRVKLRWENIMIVLIGVVGATFAVVAILASGATTEPPKQPTDPAPSVLETSEPTLLDVDADALTMEDATSLVEEARTLMQEARWDEAADRLATIPEELQALSGAYEATVELEQARAEYTGLRAQLDAAVEANKFKEARSLLAQLTTLAEHDSTLTELETTIADAEAAAKPSASEQEASSKPVRRAKADKPVRTPAPAAAPKAAAETTAKQPVRGGGAASTTRQPAAPVRQPAPAVAAPTAAPTLDTATTQQLNAAAQSAGISLLDLQSGLDTAQAAELEAAFAALFG